MLNLLDVESTRAGVSRKDEIKRILEALLFSSREPLTPSKLKEIIEETYPLTITELRQYLKEMQESYQGERRSWQIDEIAEGFVLRTVPEMHPYIQKIFQDRRGEKLSKAAMEVLAILAYRGPYTRAQIEAIRGVDSSGTLSSLCERGLAAIVGKLEAPGRPAQYGVTKRFLEHFGLKKLADLNALMQSNGKPPPQL